jgi:hypothetical protein
MICYTIIDIKERRKKKILEAEKQSSSNDQIESDGITAF